MDGCGMDTARVTATATATATAMGILVDRVGAGRIAGHVWAMGRTADGGRWVVAFGLQATGVSRVTWTPGSKNSWAEKPLLATATQLASASDQTSPAMSHE
jgi:hypothetical protein